MKTEGRVVMSGQRGEGVVPASATEPTLADLYAEHYQPLVRFAYTVTGDAHLAEDFAQEAFVRASSRLTGLRDPKAARAYLRTTVVNLVRRSFRRRVQDIRVRWHLVDVAGEAGHEDRLIVREAMLALPPRQRACVTLRYFEGMTEADTAETLGISIGTVKSQMHKAMRTLERRLEGSR